MAITANPFEEINQKLDTLISKIAVIEQQAQPGPSLIPFTEYCKKEGITRPTGYAREERGLIKTELIGGRRFVLSDSILVTSKFQRAPEVHTR